MNEFFLHEAMAQLQLGLMGLDEDFMEGTNKKIRSIFSGTNPDPHYGRDVVVEMMKKVGENPSYSVACDDDVIQGKKPVFGPLSKSVADAASPPPPSFRALTATHSPHQPVRSFP